MRYKFIIIVCFALFTSCGGGKPKNSGIPPIVEAEVEEYEETIDIPFVERRGNKYINVRINGIQTEMAFDTGASTTCISLIEAKRLVREGLLTEEDVIGESYSSLADGSIVPNMQINIRELKIDDKLVTYNVVATIILNEEAPLLLGNSVLDRAISYEIDNENKVIKFKHQ